LDKKRKKARKAFKKGNKIDANIEDEMKKMAFLLGIYGASGAPNQRTEYIKKPNINKPNLAN
jgi:hypothetical protein